MKTGISIKEIIKPKNGFHWYGIIFAIVFVVIGGAIGGAVGFLTGYMIITASLRKDYSNGKKLIYTITASIIGIIAYVILTSLFLGIIDAIWRDVN